MDIVLIAGLWLDESAWDDLLPALERRGHRGIPVVLPGQGDANHEATLQDQLDAVLAAVDAADRPLVVGHSAAATLAWLAADARPSRIAGVAFIGGFPSTEGEQYAAFFPIADGVMPFPGWEPFEGPDSADLSPQLKDSIAAGAYPVPEGVAHGIVRYRDERRVEVPTVLICPEFSPAEAAEWIRAGELPELAKVEQLDLRDLASGHWPMFTCPDLLADLLDGSVA